MYTFYNNLNKGNAEFGYLTITLEKKLTIFNFINPIGAEYHGFTHG